MQSSNKDQSESTDIVVTRVGTSNTHEGGSTTARGATTAPDVFSRRVLPASENGRVNVTSGLARGFQELEAGRVSVSPVSSQGLENLGGDQNDPSPSPPSSPSSPSPPSSPSSPSPPSAPSSLPPLSRMITPAATSAHLTHLDHLKQLIEAGRTTAADVCHAHKGWGGTTVCTSELSLRSCPDDYEWHVICSAHDPEWTKRGECTRYSDIALRQERQERQEAVSWNEVDWRT